MALTKIQTSDLSSNLATTIAQGGGIPKITSIDYPGDDTAADPAGGQTIIITGSNFTAQSSVYLAGNPVSPLSFVNSTALSFTAPALSTGVYSLYVVNSDGATAIAVPGILYSGLPTWSTASGSLGSVYETGSVSVNLEATGDGTVTYTVSAGNTIPTGLTLNSNGLLTGTVPATDPTTTYTFSVDAIDEQNQETARSFSITFLKDEVTWSSPANGTSYSWGIGVANSVALSSTSAAEKNITYSLQSGSLPANVSISGTNITGTPNTIQSNTSAIIRATAADTLRYADRYLYFTVAQAQQTVLLVNGNGSNNGTTFTDAGIYARPATRTGTYIVTSTDNKKFGTASLFNNTPNTTLTTSYLQYSTAAGQDFNLGSQDFSVECWCYLTSLTGQYLLFDMWTAAAAWKITVDDGSVYVDFNYNSSYRSVYSSQNITANAWHHIRWNRVGGRFSLVINGTERGATTLSPTNGIITYGDNYLRLMNRGSSVKLSPFYMDDVRIVRGGVVSGLPTSELTVI